MNEKKMILMNKDLYKKKLSSADNNIFEYVKILDEYLLHITKNIKIINVVHNKFIINRGYDLLKNIFLTLLLYTKNIDLVSFHLRKSYLYYTEFIGQIGEDSNAYLQLNSKDACLFVYKKTIYEINDEFKKNFEDNDKEKTKILKKKVNLITTIEKFIVEKKLLDVELDKIKEVRLSIIKMFEEINKLSYKKIENVEIFLNFFEFSNFYIDKKISILYLFLKKINKKNIDRDILISLPLYYHEYCDLSALKFVNKIFK
jgi:hypothetical protein